MSSDDNPLNDLFNEEYCQNFKNRDNNILLEQYKLYVEMSNDISNRRDNCNKFYTVLTAAILTLTSFLFNSGFPLYLLIIPIALTVGISHNWKNHIIEYRHLNSAKLEVIDHIENCLPLKGFTVEYKIKRIKGCKGLTTLDENIPKYMYYVSWFLLVGLILFIIIIGC